VTHLRATGNAQASLAGVASIAAVYVDDVTLHPPEGFAGSTVTFGMVANYNLQVDATRGAAAMISRFMFHNSGNGSLRPLTA
jgi:hypothetical protein